MSTKKQPFKIIDGSLKPDAYAMYGGNGGEAKFTKAMNSAVDSYNGISHASYGDTYQNIRPNISSRPEFSRQDYEAFRPGEAIPKKFKDMVLACDSMYYSFSLVRNIIDLMSDFACQGIRFVHPVKNNERFYNAWFKKVNGFDRSERFLNYLYRHGMNVVEARTGTMTIDVEREFYSYAGEVKIQKRQIQSKEVPLQYIFHHPAIVEPRGNINSDKITYEIKVSNQNQEYIDQLVPFGFTGTTRILPPDKTFVAYFKKDDWYTKPVPFLYTLIPHAIMLNKLRLADSAALDGAISSVRIFKLGNMEYKIAPTDAAVAKLDEILQSNVAGGTLDIIWGPDIELLESNTNVHNFLGEEKYTPHMEQMYNGLGIARTLAGAGGTGTTNNYISLKVMMKRLQYGRKRLLEFWEEQIKWIQKAMGFARPAKIEFDFLDLGDEQAEKAILIQLADRNLISDEKLQSIFGYDSEMEKTRLNRESRERRSGRRVAKPSPFSDSFMDAAKKIALQRGYVSPAQMGIEMEPGTEGQKTPFSEQLQAQKQRAAQTANTAKNTKGRPQNSKDSKKRKTKVFKPVVKASLDIWANQSQENINSILKPEYLKSLSKSNFRQLTQKEGEYYEQVAFGVLNKIEPFTNITKELVVSILENPLDTNIFKEYLTYAEDIKTEIGRELSLEENRKIQLLIYTSLHGENLDESR